MQLAINIELIASCFVDYGSPAGPTSLSRQECNSMFRSIVLLVGAIASLSASSLLAQDVVLGQKYGLGVHAYFAGDYVKAYEQLIAAIDGGSKDPRAFYFRGLAYLKLGRTQEANLDFQKGAELESRDFNKFYNVAKSLERVQGAPRVALENFRIEARLAVLEEAERMRKARYEAIQREEQRVLRDQAQVPPPLPEATKGAEATPAADVDVFAKPEEKPASADEKKPAAATPADKTPAETPATEEKPAEKKADSSDPFAS
jgi:tetratricopeptide (TPR) repeat protein